MNKEYYDAIIKCDDIIKQEENLFTKKVFREILNKLYKLKTKKCSEREELVRLVNNVYKFYENSKPKEIKDQINLLFKEEVL